jgi:hypothetical protein
MLGAKPIEHVRGAWAFELPDAELPSDRSRPSGAEDAVGKLRSRRGQLDDQRRVSREELELPLRRQRRRQECMTRVGTTCSRRMRGDPDERDRTHEWRERALKPEPVFVTT